MKQSVISEFSIVCCFCLIGLAFTLPAFVSDFYTGHNVLTHLIWSRHFAEQFWSGDFYPRWLMNMNAGLGSPAFYFYFPLPYYFTSIFHAPSLHLDPDGWLQLGLTCAAAFTLSGVFCYLWLRSTFSQGAATVGALVYMLVPYHLLVDLYYRFAFTEFCAFVFMPLCLFFADRIKRHERFGVVGTAVGYALLFLTHLPTVMLFSPVLLCYILIPSQQGRRTGILLQLVAAMLLGAGLAAFYWVPAILTQDNVSFVNMAQGEFHFANNFLFSLLEIHPRKLELGTYHAFVTFTTLFTLLVCLLSWLAARRQADKNSVFYRFWLIIGLFSFYMMLDISTWLWRLIPFLHRIQFPFRFNLLLCLAVAILAAAAMKSLSQKPGSLLSKVWVVAVAGLLVSQILISGLTLYQGLSSEWNAETRNIIELELARSPDVLEYIPQWANKKLFPVTSNTEILDHIPAVEIFRGEGTASIISWESGRIGLQTDGNTPLVMVVKHLYYPTWKAHLESRDLPIGVSPSTTHGFIQLEVPEGKQQVLLTLGSGEEESLVKKLSLLSLLLVVGLSGLSGLPATHKNGR